MKRDHKRERIKIPVVLQVPSSKFSVPVPVKWFSYLSVKRRPRERSSAPTPSPWRAEVPRRSKRRVDNNAQVTGGTVTSAADTSSSAHVSKPTHTHTHTHTHTRPVCPLFLCRIPPFSHPREQARVDMKRGDKSEEGASAQQP